MLPSYEQQSFCLFSLILYVLPQLPNAYYKMFRRHILIALLYHHQTEDKKIIASLRQVLNSKSIVKKPRHLP